MAYDVSSVQHKMGCIHISSRASVSTLRWRWIFDQPVFIHCVQKKTPTHIFFHISMIDVWI